MKRIRRSLVLAACAVVMAGAASGGQISQQALRSSASYSDEAYVIEQSRTTWRFETDGTGRRDAYLRVKVQSEAGVQSWGQLVFSYNSANERMEVTVVRVLKADGSALTAPASAVQDLNSSVQRVAPVYTDTREKHITVPGLRPGDILELSLTTVVHTPLAAGHFWAEHEFIETGIVLDERLQLDVPIGRSITLDTRPGLEQSVTENTGRRVYEWHTSRLANEERDKTEKKPRQRETSAVRLTTFSTWEELAQWYRALERPQRKPGPDIRRKAAELTAGRTTDIAKLEALYEYVATNFRYVSLSFGVGRYQPHSASEVLQNEYGDCKDKHTLLVSLAESIGLQASAVLINSSSTLDPDFPSPSQFDHVITRVSVGSDQVWLDATAEVAPFRLLAANLRRKQALVIGAHGAAALEDTPATTPMKNSMTTEIDAALQESGALSARVRLLFSGDFELLMRSTFRQTPNVQWKRVVEYMSERAGLAGEITDWKVADPVALRNAFTVDYRVTKASFVSFVKRQSELVLPFSEWLALPTAGDRDDAADVELGPPRESVYTLRLELPASYVAQAPLTVATRRDYAEYRAEYKVDGRIFTAQRTLGVHERELPASRRGDYAAFRRVVSGDLGQSLTLESETAASAAAPAQLTVKELFKSGSEAVEAFRYAQAVTLLKRAVELEPTHRGAWTNLGRAYLGLRQTDDAIAAFRTQIDVNPYDQYAYNNLGHAYRQQQKFNDAEAAFLKQLEIDPLNVFAHESLGGVYLEQRRYDAAAAELERGIAAAPKNARLRIRLGEALLNLGEHARARAAFARAVEIDPTPLTWNDIAYQLALKGTDLELAQRYAESAVAAVTAASRTVSVERLTSRDLSNIAELAAYWDTLGWVHFAKGDTARAERLVGAAWNLLHVAEIGDHLGQIYEKQGRRAEAIRAYALTMNAERPQQRSRARLATLVGDENKADATVRQHADELRHERTIALDVKAPAGASADYYVLLDNSTASAAPNVESVTFIGGDERLRPLADALRHTPFPAAFPDTAPAKILRRGTLSCSPPGDSTPCRFVMMSAGDARAAQQQ